MDKKEEKLHFESRKDYLKILKTKKKRLAKDLLEEVENDRTDIGSYDFSEIDNIIEYIHNLTLGMTYGKCHC